MLKIREAHINDLPFLLSIYNDAIVNTTATFDLEPESLEKRKTWFAKYGGKYPLIVSEWNGEVVGYGSLSAFREKPAFNSTTELSIYISSSARGLGIGTALMTELITRAKENGFHTMIGGITQGNEGSIALHKKFGFTLAGHFKEVGFKFDDWQDVLFYQLILPIE
ncbi:N-acetyltransferase family protein [Robertmurraya sp. GLU-23]